LKRIQAPKQAVKELGPRLLAELALELEQGSKYWHPFSIQAEESKSSNRS
jgi:hypothetical protein